MKLPSDPRMLTRSKTPRNARRMAGLLLMCAASLLLLVCLSAVGQSPRSAEDYNNRGLDRQSRGDIDGAIEKGIALKPDAGVYYARATAKQAKKDLAGAVVDYSKAIELNPSLAQAYANRAVVEILQGKKLEAGRDFDSAFRLEPDLRKTYEKFLKRLQ